MSPTILRRLFCLLAFTAASAAFAQVTFTLQYTPNSTAYGMTQGVPVTWVVTLDPNTEGYFNFDAGWMDWGGNPGSVSGDGFSPGVTGTLATLTVGPEGYVYLGVFNFLTTPQFNGNSVIGIVFNFTAPAAAPLPTFDGPVLLGDYVDAYLTGTYAIDGGQVVLNPFWIANDGLTSVTIANAIPEPSTSAALAGLGALALAAWRRRRAHSA